MLHRRMAGGAAALTVALALAIPGMATADTGRAGFVYTETNASAGNAILAYAQGDDGTLTWIGTFSTHGTGTGAVLATQGQVVLAGGGKWLLAVNAGSNAISLFRVRDDGTLALADRIGAAGTDPVSLTAYGNLVYVLDAGGSGNIAGFRRLGRHAASLSASVRTLSGSATNPAEVAFSTNGRFLVVTERATNLIDTYFVGSDGRAGGLKTPPLRARRPTASPSICGTIRSCLKPRTAHCPRTGSAARARR